VASKRTLPPGISQALGVLIVLVVVTAIFSAKSPYFFTSSNLITNLGAQDAELGIVALGMAIVIASGGIDLSVGAILGLSSVSLGGAYNHGVPLVPGILICLAVGLACGLTNGLLVVLLRLHPLLVTLGTLALYRGIAIGISKGGAFSNFPSGYQHIGGSTIGILPDQLIPWAVIAVLVYVITAHTPAGRKLLAVGINETAAALSGIRVGMVRIAVYGLSGFLAGAAGVIYTSRVFSARGDAGGGLELLAIAAVVVGGASIFGGELSVVRTTLGVILIGLIPNGFVLSQIDTSWQYVAIGAAMIAAVLTNELIRVKSFSHLGRTARRLLGEPWQRGQLSEPGPPGIPPETEDDLGNSERKTNDNLGIKVPTS
jgi:rhamnose transport system permease protein